MSLISVSITQHRASAVSLVVRLSVLLLLMLLLSIMAYLRSGQRRATVLLLAKRCSFRPFTNKPCASQLI